MHEAVEDRIGQGRISQGVMPVLDWELTGDNRGPAIVAIFYDFE
jgi:hypothetical protein